MKKGHTGNKLKKSKKHISPLTGRTKELDSFIDYYMGGNLVRFLRKHTKQYHFELSYSVTLKHIKKSNKKTYKYIMKRKLYPDHLKEILNIFITLDKHFNISFNRACFKDYLVIEDEFSSILLDYIGKTRSRWFNNNKPMFKKIMCNKRQAIKEQKERGFISFGDFIDYDSKYYHIVSIADPDLYWPENIPKSYSQSVQDNYSVSNLIGIAALSVYGVAGWTRIRWK